MNRISFIQAIFKPIVWPLILLTLITLMGVVGYLVIEKLSFIDALYMTVITEATVGFGEVKPLTTEGRIFTMILIILSFGVFAFAVTSVTNYINGGEYKRKLIKLKHQNYMNNLKNHTIVCGYGRVGRKSAEELKNKNKSYVVIENENKIIDENDLSFIHGDATMDETLLNAGIKSASHIIVALPSDSDNLMIIVTARALNPEINIIARVSNKTNESKLKNAGAHHIISPDTVGGKAMAKMAMTPDLMEFTERITSMTGEEDVLDEVIYRDTNGKKIFLKDFNKELLGGCLIVGYKTGKGELMINPSHDTEIEVGTKLFVLGKKDQIHKLHKNLG